MNNSVNFSQTLQKTLIFAEEAAQAYGSNYIGSEHLVFAMLNCTDSTAYKLLYKCGVTEPEYCNFFIRSIDKNSKFNDYTPRTKCIIEQALVFSPCATVRTEHLLLAILNSPKCLAMHILRALGIDVLKLHYDTELAAKLEVEQ